MNETTHATCVPTHDTRFPDRALYFEIRKIWEQKHGLEISRDGYDAEQEWKNASRAKRVKMHEAVRNGKWDKPKLAWLVTDFPEPQPEFLRGDEPEAEVQVKYNGMFKICSRATMDLFGLEHVRDWNPNFDK